MHGMQLSAVDANLLVILGALLERGSVAGAAKELALSPSATSHALARLRELFGDALLVRAGRRLTPTARAQELAAPLRAMLEQMRALFDEPAPLDPSRLQRTFHLLTTDHVELVLLRAVSAALAREAPGVALHGRPVRNESLAELRQGDGDLALGVFHGMTREIERNRMTSGCRADARKPPGLAWSGASQRARSSQASTSASARAPSVPSER